jgi:hypothetical protein
MNKAEMERIWHSEPVGYMKKFRNSKMKLYSVTFKPYKKVYGDHITVTVLAKNEDWARHEAYPLVKESLASNDHKMWETTTLQLTK